VAKQCRSVWGWTVFFQARALSGLLASMTRRFRIDVVITGVPPVAWEQPSTGFLPQAVPVFAQFLE
jgi:hypothetical protein